MIKTKNSSLKGDFVPSFWERNSKLMEDIITWVVFLAILLTIAFVVTVFTLTFIREIIWVGTPEGSAYNLDTVPTTVYIRLLIATLVDPLTYLLVIIVGIPLTICMFIVMADE